MSAAPVMYEVYAVRYGTHERRSSHNFLGGDTHDVPMPLDFYVWAIKGGGKTFIFDTGFDPAVGQRRQRTYLCDPGEGLKAIGIEPHEVEDVVISHMHYDHAGNHGLFPRARFHLQDKEMAYCTGRCMCHAAMRYPFEPGDVKMMVDRLFDGRLRFHEGVGEIAPGLTVHHVGGHTLGLQVMRVWTRRGWVVLASDAAHFYANIEQGRPFPFVYNVGDNLEGHATLNRLASSPAHVVPGHDPEVMKRYPAACKGLEGKVVRLDADPVQRN